jgi:hypothetical protein
MRLIRHDATEHVLKLRPLSIIRVPRKQYEARLNALRAEIAESTDSFDRAMAEQKLTSYMATGNTWIKPGLVHLQIIEEGQP